MGSGEAATAVGDPTKSLFELTAAQTCDSIIEIMRTVITAEVARATAAGRRRRGVVVVLTCRTPHRHRKFNHTIAGPGRWPDFCPDCQRKRRKIRKRGK